MFTLVPVRRQVARRILLVEDEAPIRELLRLHLSLAGFEIDEVADGRAALDRARRDRFDLIILDLMVPGLDGITLCRAIRSHSANTASAVLMLTAHASEADKVLGLESGADDYLTKPFGVREMVARVGAILRRNERIDGLASAAPAVRHVRSRDVALDPERREAIVRGRTVGLTQPGIRSPLSPRRPPRDRLQPCRAADEDLDQRYLRHRTDRRHRDQPAAAQGRNRRAASGTDPHRLGRRLQIRRRRLTSSQSRYSQLTTEAES